MSEQHDRLKSENRSLMRRLLIMAVAMFGFGYLLVPLYDVFCEITGFGGRTNAAAVSIEAAPDLTREIRIEFVTTVNAYAPFELEAEADSMTVHPGQMYFATFTGRNLATEQKIARAVPSVTPTAAAEHFVKIECFCFTSQEFAANEERALPLQFIVNPDLPDYVDTITLQYTLFDTAPQAASNPL